MFCPECGTKIDEPMNFCPECGTNLIGLFAEMEAEEAANKPQQTVSTPSAQPAAPTQSAQSNRISAYSYQGEEAPNFTCLCPPNSPFSRYS